MMRKYGDGAEEKRAIGDLDEEDEETKRKHDVRVERSVRLEKQRQDQARYWQKYQAKKRAKRETEEAAAEEGSSEENNDDSFSAKFED